MNKKHNHKYKWIEARMYGSSQPTGTVLMCDCGKMKYAVKEHGFAGAIGYKVCDKGELHQIIS